MFTCFDITLSIIPLCLIGSIPTEDMILFLSEIFIYCFAYVPKMFQIMSQPLLYTPTDGEFCLYKQNFFS
jgi:hypothetical protein